GEVVVAMKRRAVEDCGRADAALAALAVVERVLACGDQGVEDGHGRRHGDDPAGALEDDLDRPVARLRRRRDEELEMDGFRRPAGGARQIAHAGDHAARAADIDMAASKRHREQARQIDAAPGVAAVEIAGRPAAADRLYLRAERHLPGLSRAAMQLEAGPRAGE